MYQARVLDAQTPGGDAPEFLSPVRYGVWVVVEPFAKIQELAPHIVTIDSTGKLTQQSALTDLFAREARESRAMTRGSEVLEGFWVGNDCDMPGGAPDGAGASIDFDLCVYASEMIDMPSPQVLTSTYRRLLSLDERRDKEEAESAKSMSRSPSATESQTTPTNQSWTASPATIALRNLLSPPLSPSPTEDSIGSKRVASPSGAESPRQRRPRTKRVDFVSIQCAGSSRSFMPTPTPRNLNNIVDRVVELVYFLRKIIEGRDKSGRKRRVLVHCLDGYTESSIIVLSYIMSSLCCSLPEAYVHLQMVAKRSFFLYPSDKPLLRKVDARFSADIRSRLARRPPDAPSPPPSPSHEPSPSRWRWSMSFSRSEEDRPSGKGKPRKSATIANVDEARRMVEEKSETLKKHEIWFDDRRFDGFPSRILDFLYLGNLEHAGNAAMLEAIGITHVVSVGESLISGPPDFDPMYGVVGSNTLCTAAQAGRLKV